MLSGRVHLPTVVSSLQCYLGLLGQPLSCYVKWHLVWHEWLMQKLLLIAEKHLNLTKQYRFLNSFTDLFLPHTLLHLFTGTHWTKTFHGTFFSFHINSLFPWGVHLHSVTWKVSYNGKGNYNLKVKLILNFCAIIQNWNMQIKWSIITSREATRS